MGNKARSITAVSAAAMLALCLMLAAGCNKDTTAEKGNPGPPPGVGGLGGTGTPSGMRTGSGGPGGGPGGGAIAADAPASEILDKKCKCHGPGAKGGKNAPSLVGGGGKSDEELTKIIHDGKGKMPAFASQLSDDQIKKVVAELKTLK